MVLYSLKMTYFSKTNAKNSFNVLKLLWFDISHAYYCSKIDKLMLCHISKWPTAAILDSAQHWLKGYLNAHNAVTMSLAYRLVTV